MNKMITLDVELVEKLMREDNASKLINELLIKHYDANDWKKLSTPELRLLQKKRAIKKEYDDRIKELEAENGIK